MNANQVAIIERLREAAMNHGEVADLLNVLEETLSSYLFDGDGNENIQVNDEQADYLKAAVTAAAFVRYDDEC